MIPTDSEFMLLYLCYLGAFLYFIWNLYITKKKKFKVNLIILSIYSGLILYFFSDEENFKGGSSLAVLFYMGMLLLTHLIVYGLIELIKNSMWKIENKKSK